MKKTVKISLALAVIAVMATMSSCVKDLEVTPIDPNTTLPEDVLNSQEAFNQLLAKCYQGLSSSSSDGPGGGPDIDGVDGGYGQYFRAVVNMQELASDVIVCCWNDGSLPDIHNMTWNASNEFIYSMYARIFYQISICNEFIRQSLATSISGYDKKEQYIAEARALRLLSWYHAIDMFGNVPFADETSSVGATQAPQYSRAELFDWMETECLDLLKGNGLADPGRAEYGRADKGLVTMILAKLYLNAEIWAGKPMYDKCAEYCSKLIEAYPLHSNYQDLFLADNHLWSRNTTYNGDELIFVSQQDGNNLQSYGSTNYIVFGSTFAVEGEPGKTMDVTHMGISSGWSGLSMTGAFTSKFEEGDARALFFKGDFNQYLSEWRDSKGASDGWKSMKFRNVNHDGTAAQAQGFVDIDFPVFRSADAYLMYAECAARGNADNAKGQEYLNTVRRRAGMGDLKLTLNNIIDERGRELYLEGFRRQDLVRFGLYTSSEYLWEFKGGEPGGKAVPEHFNLFPISSSELNANGNLKQNPDY